MSDRDKVGTMPERNERCPCGSGKKYKKCCIGQEKDKSDLLNKTLLTHLPPSATRFTLRGQNKLLLAAIDRIFGIQGAKAWDDVKRNVTAQNVCRLYEFLVGLWSPRTDIGALLEHSDSKLRALYLGEIALSPQSLTQSICRFGLYTDEILVVCPFQNPWTTNPHFNPLLRPERYLADTLKVLYFFAQIAPWIEAGIVTIVPDPSDFDPALKDLNLVDAEAQMRQLKIDPADLREVREIAKMDLLRQAVSISPEFVKETLLRKQFPSASPEEIEIEFERLREEVRADPLTLHGPYIPNPGQLLISRSGAAMPSALRLSDLSGAFPYTNQRTKWNHLLRIRKDLSETSKVWSPLTKAFHELDFKFLNNVDAKFAVTMRQEGRLEMFRSYLRKLWGSLKVEAESSNADAFVRDFRDELHDAYRKTEDEWKDIDRDLIKWGTGGIMSAGVVTAAASAATISGGLTLALPMVVVALSGVPALVNSKFARDRFRAKSPLSVFLDLSRHRPEGSRR